jgi:hypothetical protein
MQTPMFDESLHKNEHNALIVDPYVCSYCQTSFDSRNKLFYHLGFMGIDVRHSHMGEDGDIDYELKEYLHKKKKQRKRWRAFKRSYKVYNFNSNTTSPVTQSPVDEVQNPYFVGSKRTKYFHIEDAISALKI